MDNKLHNLASYLESLAIMETQVASLECLMVMMLENIPNIHTCHTRPPSLLRTFSHTPVLEIEESGESTGDVTMERAITYRDFMETWSVLIELAEDASTSADPLHGVQARKPKDFQIFINLVDFCSGLYKLLATSLKPDHDAMDTSNTMETKPDMMTCYLLVKKFSAEVIL
ncbi:hypothetical protein DPMN_025852 [Dreissena polymorpha]|uniref:DNA-PKcs N-terminal domain-containing protein n=1 Tax=Dreissena polymorpha TaxID=45954 RepID=A0A9D4RDP9_DREPO|nr:hypothetical protein DPMN_025852 [Dreissena polymorpha]